MKATLERTPNLRLIQAEVVRLCTKTDEAGNRTVRAVVTRLGEEWACDCVILSTGTFLDSAIFVGNVSYEAGPDGMLPSKGLSASLREEGLKLLRFKTGTPARVNRRSIDFSVLE